MVKKKNENTKEKITKENKHGNDELINVQEKDDPQGTEDGEEMDKVPKEKDENPNKKDETTKEKITKENKPGNDEQSEKDETKKEEITNTDKTESDENKNISDITEKSKTLKL